jgi:hypothetical protein
MREAGLVAAIILCLVGAALSSPVDDKYAQLGGPAGSLGAPNSPESIARDGAGKMRHYERGSIFWHPLAGAHEVHGLILRKWAELGWERSYLGYPLTDEIATFDRGGRVTKFQGGELIWRSATNKVSEVRSTDLVIDLPFATGEPWLIVQANAASEADHHRGPWVYCWDFILAGKKPALTDGRVFVSAADGRIVHVEENNGWGGDGDVLVQRLGTGRYLSYLHLKDGSYTRHFGAAHTRILPQMLPWNQRPIARSGVPLAEVGDTGMPFGAGAYHLHFCITTKPDRHAFAPFESVPIAFRSYSFSTDQGRTWRFVPVGVPHRGEWVRRESNVAASAPQISDAAAVVNFGTIKGRVSPVSAGAKRDRGKLVIDVLSQWGEPVARTTLAMPEESSADGIPYEIREVPAFNSLKVVLTYEALQNAATNHLLGESERFDLGPNATATIDLQLRTP